MGKKLKKEDGDAPSEEKKRKESKIEKDVGKKGKKKLDDSKEKGDVGGDSKKEPNDIVESAEGKKKSRRKSEAAEGVLERGSVFGDGKKEKKEKKKKGETEDDLGVEGAKDKKKKNKKEKAAAEASELNADNFSDTRSVRSKSSTQVRKKKKPRTESSKYVGTAPEWKSSEVRSAGFLADGFVPCTVMIMEEDQKLTEYTNYLNQAVSSGMRKQFVAIDGKTIENKVKQFMIASGIRAVGLDDETHIDRMDLWAEAIKHTLLSYKRTAVADLQFLARKENGVTGTRSKEFLRRLPNELSSTATFTNTEVSDTPRLSKTGAELKLEKRISKGSKSIMKKDQKSRAGMSTSSMASPTQSELVAPKGSKPTLLTKRGEIPIPNTDTIDDAPPTGPHNFFILQGFYNPLLIKELLAIGVPVDGLLLMTAGVMEKRNFSVVDVEQRMGGSFNPRNVLPQYAAKVAQGLSMVGEKEDDVDLVAQFWIGFTKLINTAEPYSAIHDIALLNCPLPTLNPIPTTPDQKGVYAINLFDEVSKRIYEMLVLNDWFQEYKVAARAKEVKPFSELSFSYDVYERLINQVPAECVTVPIVMECMVEQVVATMDMFGLRRGSQNQSGGKVSRKEPHNPNAGSDVDWINGYRSPGTTTRQGAPPAKPASKRKSLQTPHYIKSNDLATMRTCHLNETFAARIASSQICGDLHNIQPFLWEKIPKFNKSLHMKLVSNLNHFMNFMPQDEFKFDDMFFILHLLLAAGVELHLQKKAESLALADAEAKEKANFEGQLGTDYEDKGLKYGSRGSHSSIGSSVNQQYPSGAKVPGTNLKADHNYMAIKSSATGETAGFLMTPSSTKNKYDITNISPVEPTDEEQDYDWEMLLGGGAPSEYLGEDEEYPGESLYEEWSHQYPQGNPDRDYKPKKQSKHDERLVLSHTVRDVPLDPLDKVHGAVVAAAGVIGTAGDFLNFAGEYEGEDQYFPRLFPTPPNSPLFRSTEEYGEIEYEGEGPETSPPEEPIQGLVWGQPQEGGNRFIACEKEWFKSLSDYSVLETLLECPALLAISESGAMDLSSWVESYLFCSGMSRAAGEGTVIGDLKDWNFVEEYNPVQIIQVLNAAANSYLCMERMYCPFYDTLLFIFNNPTPRSLKAESNCYYKMKTLPGLQHFLEYSVNDTDVREWLVSMEQDKGVEAVDSFSATTLMRLVPEDQWMLIPSIKWILLQEQNGLGDAARQMADYAGGGDRIDEDDDDEFGQLKKKKKLSSASLNPSDTKEVKTKKPPAIIEAENVPSFNFTDALKASSKGYVRDSASGTFQPPIPRFNCYDIGKRLIIMEGESRHLFPLDGTVISYDKTSIDPEYNLIKITVSKNSHQTYFYPYYIPRNMDLSEESYVVCPYFHMVHANGTIYGFQDLRDESAPYMRLAMKPNYPQPGGVFSVDDIHYVEETPEEKRSASDLATIASGAGLQAFGGQESELEGEGRYDTENTDIADDSDDVRQKDKTAKKSKTPKKGKKEKSEDIEKPEKKKKKKKGKKGKEEDKPISSEEMTTDRDSRSPEFDQIPGDWNYASSENTDAEQEIRKKKKVTDDSWKGDVPHTFKKAKRAKQYNFGWDSADQIIAPLTHAVRITLPSGLFIQVNDVKGPPYSREVKQSYLAKGSSTPMTEASRYYTSKGTVVKFMLNKTIQILTARGVTTCIRKLSTNTVDQTDDEFEDIFDFDSKVKLYNGDVIHPTGEVWHIVNGRNVPHDPFYVFTSGVMPNGEIFRRRQDGVTYLHRHDGTVITHYPDGTRFTTRMIILKDKIEEFEDWVFVGLKYMVEHPNYATVLFNTISCNVHIRISPGEWVRVFADGSVKVGTKDDYKLDVDKNRAVLASPACVVQGEKETPNLTSIKLYHSPENTSVPNVIQEPEQSPPPTIRKEISQKYLEEEGEDANANPLSAAPSANYQKGSNSSIVYGATTKLSHESTINLDLREPVPSELEAKLSKNSLDRQRGLKSMSLEEADSVDLDTRDLEDNTTQDLLEIEAFLTFTDKWTICRAMDSWGNRFAVDIFGDTVVDKSPTTVTHTSYSKEDLIDILSTNFQLPPKVLSGILKVTSSENLSTRAKRLQDLTQKTSRKDKTCKLLPKSKIFVVRRDLSGYEYLRNTEVDQMILAAKNSKGGYCLTEPIPGQPLRKSLRQLVTIMDSLENHKNVPQGVWKTPYREPVFRPRYLANKHLQAARPEDLRWFGYVLTTAHNRRPRFFLSPRAEYLKKRITKKGSDQNSKAASVGKAESIASEENEVMAELTDDVELDQKSLPEDATSEKAEAHDEGKKKKGKGKKAKKSEAKESIEESTADIPDTPKHETEKKGKKDKKKKSEAVDKKKSRAADDGEENPKTKSEKRKQTRKSRASDLDEEGSNSKLTKSDKQKERKSSNNSWKTLKERYKNLVVDAQPADPNEEILARPAIVNLNKVDIGKYREDIVDISGLYGFEEPEEVAVKAQFHPDHNPTKRAIIVRTIVEIPGVDQKLQRALLAASMSYTKTIEKFKNLHASYETRDPRSADEKQRQQIVKQRLIGQNAQDLHLYKQTEGELLEFDV